MPTSLLRLYVRVDGHDPFALIVPDNLMPEHYVEIATAYYSEKWHFTRKAFDLILLRRIIFRNKDMLLDFRRKKSHPMTDQQILANVIDSHRKKKEFEKSSGKLYHLSAGQVRDSMTVTNPVHANLMDYCDTDLVIRSITLPRLIKIMTDLHTTPYWKEVFWCTFRTFASKMEVLTLLMERYDVPPLFDKGGNQRSVLDVAYYNYTAQQIKANVISMLEHWTANYLFDFADDILFRTLSRWLRKKMDTDGISKKCLNNLQEGDRRPMSQRKPPLLPGIHSVTYNPHRVLGSEFSPAVIAQQITLLTAHVFRNLQACELVGRQWEEEGGLSVPNFVAYRDYINTLVNWTTYAVVNEPDLTSRVGYVTKIVAVCDELMKMNNWDALVALYGGLQDPATARLTRTLGSLVPETQAQMQNFDRLLSTQGTSKVLKNAMAASPRPHFISIVTHLRDLIYLEETVPILTVEGQINFLRCISEYNTVQYLLDGKGSFWDIPPILEILGSFSSWRLLDDDILMDMSVQIES